MTATVRVVGPPRSGVTSLADALRDRLAGHHVVEADDAIGPPAAVVVAACSAVAPLTESDCAAIDVHASTVDVVIGVLTKVDAHRRWRDVLDADRAALAAFDPRYRDVTWVGVAAAPDGGTPSLDELVTAVCNPSLLRKNLQRRMSQRRPQRASDGDLGEGLQRQRIRLGRHHRQRCVELRTAQRDRAARASRAETAEFGTEFAQAAGQVLVDLRDRIGTGAGDVAPELPPLPPRGGGAESRLTIALGAGFGLGVAATVGRVATALAPGFAVTAVAPAVLAGCVLTAWLVSTRALLHRRATLDRWVTEAVAAVRTQGEEMIADALLEARAEWRRAP